MMRLIAATVMLMVSGAMVGCSGRPTVIPSNDPALNKLSTELAAEAAKRFPYPASAEQAGQAVGRAQVGYTMNVMEIVNLSDEPWTDVDVWVNRAYVVHLPVMEPKALKRVPFKAIYNDRGRHFPLRNDKMMINQVELVQDGKIYNVPLQLAD